MGVQELNPASGCHPEPFGSAQGRLREGAAGPSGEQEGVGYLVSNSISSSQRMRS
jgi:hypothetical protein